MTVRQWIVVICVALVALLIAAGVVGTHLGYVQFTKGSLMPSFSLHPAPRQPAIDKSISFPPDFPEDAKAPFNDELAKTRAALQADPNDVSAWFDLAIEYRTVSDYADAVEIWQYIHAAYPSDGVSLHNLGEYYFHTAKEYPTAERYYMEAIQVAPQLESDYTDLSDMYRYAYEQTSTKAADILKEGIANVPGLQKIDLEMYLADYYSATGDKIDARTYYLQARDAATVAGNAKLAAQIDQLVAALGK